jgi:hypothetical protein|tara:strand:- start:463 stop:747 length:285 start_codon:yes stop_codon:yes gene_type:complete
MVRSDAIGGNQVNRLAIPVLAATTSIALLDSSVITIHPYYFLFLAVLAAFLKSAAVGLPAAPGGRGFLPCARFFAMLAYSPAFAMSLSFLAVIS